MEVSGKRVPMSEEELTCLPCSLDGLTEPVYGYCQDCQEHLCETCFKHHRRARPSRNHVLLDTEAMPKDQSMTAVKSGDETDFCTRHIDKRLEFYCSKHKAIACYVCVTLGHKTCEVDYIPDISGNISESDEFSNLMMQLRIFKEKCETNIKRAKSAGEQIDHDHIKVIEEIKVFRKEINDCLDRVEAEITRDIVSLVSTGKKKWTDMHEACQELVKGINETESSLNKLNEDNQNNKLFIEMKKVEESLSFRKNKEKQTRENNETHDGIEFIRNQKFIDLLKAEKFGTIVLKDLEGTTAEEANESQPSAFERSILASEDKPVNFHFAGTIDIKSPSDKTDCNVCGIVLIPPQNIIVADRINKFLKVIDRERNTLINELSLSSQPYDIIRLPQNKLAVALSDEKCIQILSLTGTTLSADRRLDVKEACRGLAYCQDKFVVACNYNPGKVIILNIAGNMLTAFGSHFYGPEKVVVSKDKTHIYVSDYYISNRKFVKMDWQGNVLKTFEGKECRAPVGIQELDDGTFLVCYRGSNTIVRLSSSCKQREITGLEKATLWFPQAIAYCEKQRKLFVSCASEKTGINTVKVFDVKWT